MKQIFIVCLVVGLLVTNLYSNASNLSDALRTLPTDEEWSIMAHAAAGSSAGESYLKSALGNGSSTDYEKRILAITALGQNPRTWGNENFVDSLLKKFDGTQMGDTGLLNDDIFGILALHSAGESNEVISKLRSYILAHQNSNGGWGFSTSGSSDSNTTAMAIAALSASGSVPSSALDYLAQSHTSEGGYSYTPGGTADGASTAWAMIGLNSANKSISPSTTAYLESLQLPNGGFKWKEADNTGSTLTTAYSVIALSGAGLPVRVVPNSSPTPTTPIAQPQPAPSPTPTVIEAPPQPAPIPTPPAPVPATPTPAPTKPQPTPTPIVVAAPTPTVAIEAPTITTPQPNISQTYWVTITYPGNIIYVGQVNLSNLNFTTTSGKTYTYSNPRAIHTLISAAQEINLLYTIKQTALGPFVDTVNGYSPTSDSGWLYAVNGQIPAQGSADYQIQPGDKIQWFFGNSSTLPY